MRRKAVVIAALVLLGVVVPPRAWTGTTQEVRSRRSVVITRLVPGGGESRPNDGLLFALMIQQILLRDAPDVELYDGVGPPAATWIAGSFVRESDGGRFRIEIVAGRPGDSWQTAAAVGRPKEALKECLCVVHLVPCDGNP